jgi:CPA2 family monovalent cation:H+ antiporter-2
LVFGLALSVASTVVLLPALSQPLGGEPSAGAGHAAEGGLLAALALTLAKVAGFIALMMLVGTRLFPRLLEQVARTGSRELFTLAAALGIAFGSAELFGVSFALGALFAGVIVNGPALSRRAARNTQPLQDAFAVLFFVSVGMLFDPAVLLRQPLQVLAVVAIVVVGKPLAALLIVLAFRRPLRTALTIAASLAQIGEFSFIPANLGLALDLLPAEGHGLILAAALLSITLNPPVFHLTDRLQRRPRALPVPHLPRRGRKRSGSALGR